MKIDKENQNKSTFSFSKKDLEKALKKYLKSEGKYEKADKEKTTFLLNGRDCVELSIVMIVESNASDKEDFDTTLRRIPDGKSRNILEEAARHGKKITAN